MSWREDFQPYDRGEEDWRKDFQPFQKEEKQKYKAPLIHKGIEKLKKETTKIGKNVPRYGMQAAIGTALGRLLTSSAGVPALLGSVAFPGAIQEALAEEKEFAAGLPENLRKELPEYIPEVAEKAAQKKYQQITGKHGILARGAELPFEAAGIEAEPQTPGEEAIRTTSELISAFGGPQAFTELLFDQLPNQIKDFFKNKPAELLNKLIGGEKLPESVYETAENILKEAQVLAPKEIPAPTEESLLSSTRKQITERPFVSEFTIGTEETKAIQDVAHAARQQVNAAYDLADEAYEGINDIYPTLSKRLEETKNKILSGRKMNLLNSAEKNVVESIDNLLGSLAQEGGFIEQPVSALLRTAKSWSAKMSHEEIYGDVKRFLSNLIPDINQAALRAVERKGGNPELLKHADQMYAEWANKFANDEISPFLMRTIRNPEALARKTFSDEGTYRAVKDAISGTPYENIISDINADIVESRLSPYLKDVTKVGSPAYQKELRELEPLIGKEQIAKVDIHLRDIKSKIKPNDEKISKFLKSKPEEIIQMGESRSGIKELKQKLSKSEKGKQLFDIFKRQKIRDILTKNKITKKMTGKDLYNVLSDRKNYEILSELMGQEETNNALEMAEKMANHRFTSQALKKIALTTGQIKFYKYLVDLLP